ncbi:hypothetical protein VULLAG_LOCUS10465 [Vulpes lagopus]
MSSSSSSHSLSSVETNIILHVEEWEQTPKSVIMFGNGDKRTQELGVTDGVQLPPLKHPTATGTTWPQTDFSYFTPVNLDLLISQGQSEVT